jgi:hypothetical protein
MGLKHVSGSHVLAEHRLHLPSWTPRIAPVTFVSPLPQQPHHPQQQQQQQQQQQ